MLVGHLIGGSLVGWAVMKARDYTPANRMKKNLEQFEIKVRSIEAQKYGWRVQFLLPEELPFTKFLKHIELIEQNTYSKIEVRQIAGRICEMKLGTKSLSDCFYTENLPKDGLKIPLMTPFGMKQLDFGDETSCHVLIGGASRMGKTALLRLITAHLMAATGGNVEILFCDNKINDLYMFQSIPQIRIGETIIEAEATLESILEKVYKRKSMLKERGDCVDIHQFRRRYPDEPVNPIFVIIDEYGRYAESERIQELVTELAETAGYLDVHLILAAQRPDASEVLAPRIKANIVTRIAFTTSDATNSNIILGSPDAAHLGRIQGRAILLDGTMMTVQVPYLSPEKAEQLLKPYYKECTQDDRQGQNDNNVIEEVQSHEPRSSSDISLSRSDQPDSNRQPYLKEIIEGLAHNPDTTP